ncbi:MAG: amino acid permease [Bacteroidia bacterium]|nr:amino acid permease [Bacteroidia bacterium]MDW8345458.1 amino acid permease [Bacteroidia bacterium]
MNYLRKKSVSSFYESKETKGLAKHLTVIDITGFGIAAIIGAGIFSTIGKASADGGPAITLLFIFTAIACSFSAFCYAEFASMVPVSGSAYTYAYIAFGEIIAWIIGWDLIMEYAIGNIVVAISWSEYFVSLWNSLSDNILGWGYFPKWLSTDYYTGFKNGVDKIAPTLAGLPIMFNLPAALITLGITWLTYKGIKESRTSSNIFVIIKLAVIFMVIVLGSYYVKPENWTPFTPEGMSGVLKGISAIFFAYIGFDAISTTAEECKNPQKDLPKGIIFSLIICTVLYVLITLVITGMVNYKELRVADPLAYVFEKIHAPAWISMVISISAVVAMASVLLVFQLGQPRIWLAMSRDGLLPKSFGKIHPKYQTPSFSTILTGLVVGLPSMLFIDANLITDLTSIGTLFAFVLVSGGVAVLQVTQPNLERKFKVPFVPAKYFLPLILILILVVMALFNNGDIVDVIKQIFLDEKQNIIIGRVVFIILWLVLIGLSFKFNFSLIPLLGVLTSGFMMLELSAVTWYGFFIWLIIGMIVYFGYSVKNSTLNVENSNA